MAIAALVANYWLLAMIAVTVMAVTCFSAAFYAMRVPETSLAEFRGALSHDEILLMVDVPRSQVAEIEDLIRHRHPSAQAGGSSWTLDMFGL